MKRARPSFSLIRGLGLAVALAFWPLATHAAPVEPNSNVNTTSTNSAKSHQPAPYKIAVTDKLGISVVGEDDLSVVSRVDAKGTINLKLLGEVNVYGLTVSAAQKAIEAAYRDGRYLRNPQVTITIEDYAPRVVTITGQIKSPSRYSMPVETAMSLVDLIGMAGGFTDTAKGTEVRVTRVYPDGTRKTFTVDVDSLMKGKDHGKAADAEFPLEANDLVFVPERVI